MNAGTTAVAALLAVAVISAWICCLGLLVMGDFFERLHYMAPVSTVSMFAVLAAVVVQEGWGQATIKTILIALVIFLMNAVLTHATARAARVRRLGHWAPDPKEHIAGGASTKPAHRPPKEDH